jgi:hypothetical protein
MLQAQTKVAGLKNILFNNMTAKVDALRFLQA